MRPDVDDHGRRLRQRILPASSLPALASGGGNFFAADLCTLMTFSSKSPLDSGYQPANLIELLQARSLADPEGISFKFLSDGDAGETALCYRELDMRARAIAATL